MIHTLVPPLALICNLYRFGYYNLAHLPDTIQFKYGNQVLNRYAAYGRELNTEYFTKTMQLTTPIDTGTIYAMFLAAT
jgi:hypothetical protein